MRGLEITEGGDVAFCHSLNGVSGTNTGGKRVEMWWRATTCFRKIDGQWLVTHGHSSEPFDMRSGKALLDLKP
jgi:ketosteroid isomerase-like protein